MTDQKQDIKVFISYAHNDQAYFEVFMDTLKSNMKTSTNYNYEIWDDRNIHVGSLWDNEIQNNLATSDLALLLVSDSFLASDYIKAKEFGKLIKQHQQTLIIPIMFAPCDFRQWDDLARRQFFMPKGDQYGKAIQKDFTFADLVKFRETDGNLIPNPNINRYVRDLIKSIELSSSNYLKKNKKKLNFSEELNNNVNSDVEVKSVKNKSSKTKLGINRNFNTYTPSEKLPGWVLIVSVVSGLVFLVVLLLIAVFIPHPTTFQIFIFRVVLSLAAAAFGATISGFLKINIPLWKGVISAGGALGLCILVYTVNPPALIRVDDITVDKTSAIQPIAGTILDLNGEPLPDVTVTIPEFNQTVTTDPQGRFSFEIKAPNQYSVQIMAIRQGYETWRQYATIGNKNLTFKMTRKE